MGDDFRLALTGFGCAHLFSSSLFLGRTFFLCGHFFSCFFLYSYFFLASNLHFFTHSPFVRLHIPAIINQNSSFFLKGGFHLVFADKVAHKSQTEAGMLYHVTYSKGCSGRVISVRRRIRFFRDALPRIQQSTNTRRTSSMTHGSLGFVRTIAASYVCIIY